MATLFNACIESLSLRVSTDTTFTLHTPSLIAAVAGRGALGPHDAPSSLLSSHGRRWRSTRATRQTLFDGFGCGCCQRSAWAAWNTLVGALAAHHRWRSAPNTWHTHLDMDPTMGTIKKLYGCTPLSEECLERAPQKEESPEPHIAGWAGVGSSNGWSGWRVTGLRELREVEATPL
jgi:hypothetical protein